VNAISSSGAIGSRLRRLAGAMAQRRWALAVVTGWATIAIIVLRFRMWEFDLRLPLAYNQDALYFQVMVKALGEGAWNNHIARLGAPFGFEAVDFPIRCSLDYAVMKIFMLLFHNPFLVVNLYWLLSTGAAAAAAALFLRFLRVSPEASMIFGVCFGITPFVFFRSVAHLNLAIFIVPAAAYLAVAVARGDAIEWLRVGRGTISKVISPGALAVAIGFTYSYWAFFACVLITVAAIISCVSHRRPRVFIAAGALITLILLSAVINLAPSLLYWQRHGRNPEMAFKSVPDADVYGLRLRQMLTPVAYNGVEWLQRVRAKIVAAGFPEDAKDANESVSAALGVLGSLGFVVLVLVAVASGMPAGKRFPDDTARILASLTLALVLIATTGGIGGLFNIFVTNEFRCYNRVSPFISLFSLAVLAFIFDRFLSNRPALLRVAVAAGLVLFAAFDQIPLYYLSFHRAIERQVEEDAATFRAIEKRMPSGAMVFQLPFMPFPVDSGVQRLPYYENAKPYLNSTTLRWSWGEISGRHGNWSRSTAALPTKEMLEGITTAGFTGLLLNRRGFADRKQEEELTELVGPPALVSPNTRWVFFDLRIPAR
jgi:phosphoglycerol transferase